MFFRLIVLIFLLIFATQVFSVIPFGYKYTKDQKSMLLVTSQMTIPFGYNLISLFGVKNNFLVGYVSNNSLEKP